jgi:aerobic-type carbon monoxide dehydrogenase small subunit (CoxS/CutS family)
MNQAPLPGVAFQTDRPFPQMAGRLAVQEAFRRNHALQCGYCTPGMVLTSVDLLRRSPNPDERCVREGRAGNLCRCTGYEGIVAAVLEAAAVLGAGKEKASSV